jgi:hypothetical protein
MFFVVAIFAKTKGFDESASYLPDFVCVPHALIVSHPPIPIHKLNQSQIRAAYSRFEFPLDLLSALPLDLLALFHSPSLLYWLRLTRVLHVRRFEEYSDALRCVCEQQTSEGQRLDDHVIDNEQGECVAFILNFTSNIDLASESSVQSYSYRIVSKRNMRSNISQFSTSIFQLA